MVIPFPWSLSTGSKVRFESIRGPRKGYRMAGQCPFSCWNPGERIDRKGNEHSQKMRLRRSASTEWYTDTNEWDPPKITLLSTMYCKFVFHFLLGGKGVD